MCCRGMCVRFSLRTTCDDGMACDCLYVSMPFNGRKSSWSTYSFIVMHDLRGMLLVQCRDCVLTAAVRAFVQANIQYFCWCAMKQGTQSTPEQQLIRHVETPTVRVYNCECAWLCSMGLVCASLSADAMTSSHAVCGDADAWVSDPVPSRSSVAEPSGVAH